MTLADSGHVVSVCTLKDLRGRDECPIHTGSLERFSRTRKTEVRVGVVKDRRKEFP